MSPEQARGEQVDARTDLFSFGAVLYEMATGRRAFAGNTTAVIFAQILKEDPPPIADVMDGRDAPAGRLYEGALQQIISKCLEKDRDLRCQDASDVRADLKRLKRDTTSGRSTVPVGADPSVRPAAIEPGARAGAPLQSEKVRAIHESPVPVPALGSRRILPWALAGIILGAAAVFAIWHFAAGPESAARREEKFTITLPAGDELASLDTQALALSPDGSKLVYVASDGKTTQLYLRPLDQLEAQPLAGAETTDEESPFFSPDGQWIGFKPSFSLKKVSSKGGPPATIAGIVGDLGATWSEDGAITVAEAQGELIEVPAAGGATRPLMEGEHSAANTFYRWPQALPGGAVLFNSSNGSNWDQARIEVFSPKTGQRRVLLEGGTCPHYVTPGYIVFQRDAQLMAVPFDLKSLKITGEPAPTLVHVRTDTETGAAQFALSDNGTLAYVPGGAVAPQSQLVWLDRKGDEEAIPAPPRDYNFPHLSPDGTRVAFCAGWFGDIWVYDLTRQTLTPLTHNESNHRLVWSPDGRKIAFGQFKGHGSNAFLMNADGSGEEQLTTGKGLQPPYSFSPDGRLLAYYKVGPDGVQDGIWILPLAGDRKSQFFRPGGVPEFSPDGRWLSYSLCVGGSCQLDVAPFPGPGEQEQVSVNGGWESRWSPNGREILWDWNGKVMAVSVTPSGSALKLGKPQVLFQTKGDIADVSPDGKRFLMVQPLPTTPATQINLILNWAQNLKLSGSTSTAQ